MKIVQSSGIFNPNNSKIRKNLTDQNIRTMRAKVMNKAITNNNATACVKVEQRTFILKCYWKCEYPHEVPRRFFATELLFSATCGTSCYHHNVRSFLQEILPKTGWLVERVS